MVAIYQGGVESEDDLAHQIAPIENLVVIQMLRVDISALVEFGTELNDNIEGMLGQRLGWMPHEHLGRSWFRVSCGSDASNILWRDPEVLVEDRMIGHPLANLVVGVDLRLQGNLGCLYRASEEYNILRSDVSALYSCQTVIAFNRSHHLD